MQRKKKKKKVMHTKKKVAYYKAHLLYKYIHDQSLNESIQLA